MSHHSEKNMQRWARLFRDHERAAAIIQSALSRHSLTAGAINEIDQALDAYFTKIEKSSMPLQSAALEFDLPALIDAAIVKSGNRRRGLAASAPDRDNTQGSSEYGELTRTQEEFLKED